MNQRNSVRRAMLRALLAVAWLPRPTKAASQLQAAIVNIPPWSFEAQGRPRGIMAELVQELASTSGIDIAIARVPYARQMAMIKHGTAVLTVGIYTRQMDSIAFPLRHIGTEDAAVVGRLGAGIKSAADLRGKLVAQLRYSAYLAEIIDPQIRTHAIANFDQGLRMLLEGRVDAVIGLRTALLYAIRHIPRAELQLDQPARLQTIELGIFMSRQFHDAGITARLQAAAAKLAEQRVFERLRDQSWPSDLDSNRGPAD